MLTETIAPKDRTAKGGWQDKSLRLQLLFTIIVLASVLFALTNFLIFVEERQGVTLQDPLLNLFEARDVTWLTFIVIYAGVAFALVLLVRNPQALLLALRTYAIMVIFRMIAMYLLPLDPPSGMIPLVDPFVEYFGTGKTLSKDLFFSGHTATLFILYLTSERKAFRLIFLLLTIAVAACVIIQHVHYSIDVFAAPFFAYAAYVTALKAGTLK